MELEQPIAGIDGREAGTVAAVARSTDSFDVVGLEPTTAAEEEVSPINNDGLEDEAAVRDVADKEEKAELSDSTQSGRRCFLASSITAMRV